MIQETNDPENGQNQNYDYHKLPIDELPVNIRMGFVRKVLITVFLQLFVTNMFIYFFQYLFNDSGPLQQTYNIPVISNVTHFNQTTNETIYLNKTTYITRQNEML